MSYIVDLTKKQIDNYDDEIQNKINDFFYEKIDLNKKER